MFLSLASIDFFTIRTNSKLLSLIVFASGFKIQNENYRANHTDTWERIKKRGTLLIGVDDTFVPMDFRKKNGQLIGQ